MNTLSKMKNTLILSAVFASSLFANERHFGYTYETATMPKNAKEIEVWTTARIGRDNFYSRLDHRLEFETGLTDKLQAAFYLNWGQITSEDGAGGLVTGFNWEGISTELKYQFSNPASDPIGFALYGELGYGTEAVELEAKALFDKYMEPFMFAFNLVGEMEFEAEPGELELEEYEIEMDLAAGIAITPAFWMGLELRSHNEIAKEASGEMEFEHSALFFGPSVSYATPSWWMTFSVMPQVPGIKVTGDGMTEMQEHESIETRLLFSLIF